MKPTMRSHDTPIRMAQIPTLTPDAGEDVKQPEFSFIASWNAKWYSHFGRQFLLIFYKPKYTLAI